MRTKTANFSPFAFGMATQRTRMRLRGLGQVNLTAAQQQAITRAGNLPLRQQLAPSGSSPEETPWWQTKTAKVAGVGVGVALLAVLILT